MPTRPEPTAAPRPASGCTVVASTVTTVGPIMKTASSTTASKANAVCRSRAGRSRWDQRARTEEPTCGRAAPATAAHRCGHGTGASASTVAIIATRAAANTTMVAGSTRCCPHRSVSRPCHTENSALAIR